MSDYVPGALHVLTHLTFIINSLAGFSDLQFIKRKLRHIERLGNLPKVTQGGSSRDQS